MDRELHYHVRKVFQQKHAMAVKRMVLHCDGLRLAPSRASDQPFILGRICPAVMCRRGTVQVRGIEAGLFQSIWDI
jgi:hypothetical protein